MTPEISTKYYPDQKVIEITINGKLLIGHIKARSYLLVIDANGDEWTSSQRDWLEHDIMPDLFEELSRDSIEKRKPTLRRYRLRYFHQEIIPTHLARVFEDGTIEEF